MKKYINGAGVDVTSTVLTYLRATDIANFVNLFLIGDPTDPMADFLTDYEMSLTWSYYPRPFLKTVITDIGTVTSKVGLKVDNFTFTWRPQVTSFGDTRATANKLQLATDGFYDNRIFKYFRGLLTPSNPLSGDLNTYGAFVQFGGRISGIKVSRLGIEFTVKSLLEVADQMIPPNVIELNNTLAQYAGATPVVSDGETNIPQFTIVAPSSQATILGQCTGPTPNKVYGTDKFRYGYVVFNAGSANAGAWSPVANSGKLTVTGTDYNQFLLLAPLPYPPQPGDTFYASIQPPINLQDAAAGFGYFGFPFVPQPETAA